MSNTTQAPIRQNTQVPKQIVKKHRVRGFFAALLGTAAVNLILLSVLVGWLNSTLTNTEMYMKIVGPIATKQEVRTFVIDKAVDGLLSTNKNQEADKQNSQPGQMNGGDNNKQEGNGPNLRDIATELLGADKVAGKTDEQLRAEVEPIIKESLNQVLSSPNFAALWTDTNRTVHAQLINQLNGTSDTMSLDLNPLIVGVIDELGKTKLSFIKEKMEIGPDIGKITFKDNQLKLARTIYGYFKTATIVLIVLAVLSPILAILISVNRLRTLQRIALTTAIFSGLYALLITLATITSIGSANVVEQQMGEALFSTLTNNLRIDFIILCVVSAVLAIGSKLYTIRFRAKA